MVRCRLRQELTSNNLEKSCLMQLNYDLLQILLKRLAQSTGRFMPGPALLLCSIILFTWRHFTYIQETGQPSIFIMDRKYSLFVPLNPTNHCVALLKMHHKSLQKHTYVLVHNKVYDNLYVWLLLKLFLQYFLFLCIVLNAWFIIDVLIELLT